MERKYDVTVFGASGYTGVFVVRELATYHSEIKWCIAGRSVEKLRKVLKEIGNEIDKNLDSVDIIQADTGDESSLVHMCRSSTVIISCVGPYRFYGEPVVKQCVLNGAHYVDVCGEPQFLESMQLKYFEEAQKKNLYIIGSCGFDSIPSDFGIEYVRKKFDGDVLSVETYLTENREPGNSVNFATWQSAIHGLHHANELIPLRKLLSEKLFSKKMPNPEYSLKKRFYLFKSEDVNGWCIPFIGSDRSVVLRTQMYNFQFKNERPVQVQCYMKCHSLLYALITLLMGAIFMLMTKFSMGCYLLERFPEVFSLGTFSRNPSKNRNVGGSFSVTIKAKGWREKLPDKHTSPPNKTVTAVLSSPDSGYIATAILVVNSALVVLQEKDKLPPSGGVLTPGAAFSDTSLMKRIEKRNITINGMQQRNSSTFF
ncbi:saccharopine dehydrogenase-like oxidoreductase isoform X2 [Parasteatoda tepidariorum]|uniref:saccharopine dehydrogenase-like oxidoreductase isoform X2 n=1 Tax=Parasteatoda tepidariorum TaxID=114398 RepID=UPI001C724FD4|nr:saccharopine dehydrogenase-like oxidoreductase isoform X2 [Parasteatoda tepidariorum]